METINLYLVLVGGFPTTLSEIAHVYVAVSQVFTEHAGETILTIEMAQTIIIDEIIVNKLHINPMCQTEHDTRLIHQVLYITRIYMGSRIYRKIKEELLGRNHA